MVITINKKKFFWFCFIIIILLTTVICIKPVMRKGVYPKKFEDIVETASQKYGADSALIYSIIKAESGFNPNAVSHVGASGLMQITPQTAVWAMEQMNMDKNSDIFSPEVNINIGVWYITKLLKDNDGNLVAALASYNAGGANVEKWKRAAGTDEIKQQHIQFAETENYVEKTVKYYEIYKKLYK